MCVCVREREKRQRERETDRQTDRKREPSGRLRGAAGGRERGVGAGRVRSGPLRRLLLQRHAGGTKYYTCIRIYKWAGRRPCPYISSNLLGLERLPIIRVDQAVDARATRAPATYTYAYIIHIRIYEWAGRRLASRWTAAAPCAAVYLIRSIPPLPPPFVPPSLRPSLLPCLPSLPGWVGCVWGRGMHIVGGGWGVQCAEGVAWLSAVACVCV